MNTNNALWMDIAVWTIAALFTALCGYLFWLMLSIAGWV